MCKIILQTMPSFTNIDDTLLSNRRPKHGFPFSVQLGHDYILSLICRGAGREVDAVWYVLLLWQIYQEACVNDRFASASEPYKQHGYFMCQVGAQKKKLTCRLHSGDDEI